MPLLLKSLETEENIRENEIVKHEISAQAGGGAHTEEKKKT
jgi:hypothetical protein